MSHQHILETQGFEPGLLRALSARAQAHERDLVRGTNTRIRGLSAVNLFYQPSTRTHASFRWAETVMGMTIVYDTEHAGETSSEVKGESLADTIRIHTGYAPIPSHLVVVVRHTLAGAAEEFAAHSGETHIINAGCGKSSGQHPTQSLLDVLFLFKVRPRLAEPTITMVGDLRNGRTARSLSYLARKAYPGLKKINFVSPSSLNMMQDIKEHLTAHSVPFSEVTNSEEFPDVLRQTDVLYMTRIQKEDLGGEEREKFEELQVAFQLNSESIQHLPSDAAILHPLPRNNEILPEVDSDPRALYFKQAKYAIPVRMATLELVFGKL